MTNLFGLAACYIAIVLLAQWTRKSGQWTYMYTAVFALVQTVLILVHLFILEQPAH